MFVPQPEDFAVIGTLVVLEGLLSADNALVLALLVRHLPKDQQKRALLFGIVGAFLLRGAGILAAKWIIGLWWLCSMGAAYLLFLAVRHFVSKGSVVKASERAGLSFWQTVAVVELTDIVFAIDSILVAVALSDKVWVVYIGACLGIVLLRVAAGFFIGLIEKYPALDNLAYALVGWAGVKLAAKSLELFWESSGKYTKGTVPDLMPGWLFWSVMVLIVAVGAYFARRDALLHPHVPDENADAIAEGQS